MLDARKHAKSVLTTVIKMKHFFRVLVPFAFLASCEKADKGSGTRAGGNQRPAFSKDVCSNFTKHRPNVQVKGDNLETLVSRGNGADLYKFVKSNTTSIEKNEDFTLLLRGIIENVSSGVRPDAIESIISAWARKDPDAAIDAIQAISPGKDRQSALMVWFSNCDLSSAISLAVSKEGLLPEECRMSQGGVYMNALHREPEEIASFLRSQKIPDEYGKSISVALGSASAERKMTLESTLALASGSSERDSIVAGWIRKTAVLAPELARQELQNRQDLAAFTPMVVESGYTQDLNATRQWVDSMADSSQRAAAAAALARVWVVDNSNAASAWVASLPVGDVRDRGSLEMVRHLAEHGEKAAASEWASSISGQRIKESAMTLIRLSQ